MDNSVIVQKSCHSAILNICLDDLFGSDSSKGCYNVEDLKKFLKELEYFNYDLLTNKNGQIQLVLSL
jgi:hypothetical protein